MKNFIASLFVILFPIISFSQEIQENTNTIEETEKVEKVRKNTIRVNITNPLIIPGKTAILGYERILGDHQSFSVDFGINQLPEIKKRNYQLDETTTLSGRGDNDEIGIHVTADYRFYLAKENKYRAPRGIYIGPYISHNSFKKNNEWELVSEDFDGLVETDIRFTINTIGVELGYQFIISDRFALDFVMVGPGISNYNFKLKTDTNLSEEDQELIYGKINDFLAEKIPGYNIVIDGEGLEKRGSVNTTSFGYRFMINIGYRF